MKVQRTYLRIHDKNGTRQAMSLWIVDEDHIVAIIDWDGYGDHSSEWSCWIGKDNWWAGHVHGFKTRAQVLRYIKSRMN